MTKKTHEQKLLETQQGAWDELNKDVEEHEGKGEGKGEGKTTADTTPAKRGRGGARVRGKPNKVTLDGMVILKQCMEEKGYAHPLEIGLQALDILQKTTLNLIEESEHKDARSKQAQDNLKTTTSMLKAVLPYCAFQHKSLVVSEDDLIEESVNSAVENIKKRLMSQER